MTDNDLYYFLNFPIKIDEHEHPLLLCNCQRNNNDNWVCNKCSSNYTSCTPSFYCTYCDYNLCQKCLGELKLNQIKRSNENIIIFNNFNMLENNNCFTWQKKAPSHIHSLSLIRRVNNKSWTCDNCNQTYKNETKLLLYCSLCDYNLCSKCYMNKNTNYDYKYQKFLKKIISKRKRILHAEDFEYPYEENINKKPVIYLYPEKDMDISVQLNINKKDNELTTIYPKFNGEDNTWNVHAKPNGDIILGNKTYPYLFWEAKSYYNQEIKEGFIVKDINAEEFLENKLKILGLNDKESTDFITFWLPVLLRNKLSLCNFQSEQFFNNFKLNVNPKPDTMIRIFLSIKKLNSPIEIKEQKLEKNERKGYTLIEWGGCNN
jgi:hypothetical protein